jgi:trk system potassium uptake protein TrkH
MVSPNAPAGVLTRKMPGPRPRPRVSSGVLQVAAGFGIVLLGGFIALMLPVSSDGAGWTDAKTALFTAVSAICVTGLVIEDTGAHWSATGEIVVLLLIQVGGLGYMAGTTVVLWALGRRLGLRDRHMLRQYYGAPTLRETFSFARSVALFSLAFEAVGAVILAAVFAFDGVPLQRAAWWGVFHSVSAFNNAGFSLTGSDMLDYTGEPWLLGTMAALVIAGSLGFLPIVTFVRRRDFDRLPLDHKLVFATSALLLVAGTLFVAAAEWNNDATLGGLPAEERPMAAFFHSANSRTAGMSALDVEAMRDETKVSTIGLMFVGGAAGSTAGGLKVGAFSLLFFVMLAALRGREDVSVLGRRVPTELIQQATTLALYYVGILFAFSLLLTLTTDQPFLGLIFEAMSAIGTVGFSSVGTAEISAAGHFVLMAAMLVGRFGSLMLVLYMTKPRRRVAFHHPVDSVRLG